MPRVRNSIRRLVAVGAAVCIWLAALLQTLQSFGWTGGPEAPQFDDAATRQKMRELDYPTLQQYWQWKRSQLGVDVCIDLFTSGGLLGLAYCVLIFKRVFKRFKGGNSDLPGFMTACFFIGAILPSVMLLQSLGNTTTADLMSQASDLPEFGLQALHVSYNLIRGNGIYLFSCQFIFVSIGVALASYLTFVTGELPRRHGIFGVIVSIVGILTFIFEISVFNVELPGTAIVFGISMLLYGVVLLPIWTVWLGVELRRLKQDIQAASHDDMSVNLNEIDEDNGGSGGKRRSTGASRV